MSDVRPTFNDLESQLKGKPARRRRRLIRRRITSMAADKNQRPIIIVKRKKKGGAGHHGGAWKVGVRGLRDRHDGLLHGDVARHRRLERKRAAIFEYFKNPSMETGKSVKPAPGQMGPVAPAPARSPRWWTGCHAGPHRRSGPEIGAAPNLVTREQIADPNFDKSHLTKAETDAQAREQVQEAEHRKLETLMEELKEAVSKSQALEPFKDQLLLDITPEGIRIQIVDAQNRPMFDVGSARLRDYTQSNLHELTPYLSSVPNRISITGHTDIRPYPGQGGYSNWELSADRAHAARRALGVQRACRDEKIARVVGLSSSVLFNKDDPQSPSTAASA